VLVPPSLALVNAELFSPVWLNEELWMADEPDMRPAEREPANALLLIRDPCILETTRLGEIAELRALLDLDGEEALIPDSPAGVPARAPPAGPPWAHAKFEFPALRAVLDPPPAVPAKECHWPSALAACAPDPRGADAPGPEFRAVEPARPFPPKRAPDGGLEADPPPRWNDRPLKGDAPEGRPAKPPGLPP